MKTDAKWYWLRWVSYWGDLLHGLVGVLTFGFWDSSIQGWAWDRFMRHAEEINFRKEHK